MRILVVAATTFEIGIFLKWNKDIDVLVSGVGIPAAMYHLTKKLLQHNYDMVIQAGIAGTFTEKLIKGEVVLVKKDAFADVGVEEDGEFKTLFQLGFSDENKFPFLHGWLINPHKVLQATHLKVVTAATVNRLSDRKEQTQQIQKVFNADIESMEGAALHYICMEMNIPFLQMRSISNQVADRDKNNWKIKDAIENLNTELIKFVQTLS